MSAGAKKFHNVIGAARPLLRSLQHQASSAVASGEETAPVPDDPRLALAARESLLAFTEYTYQAELDADRREAYQTNFHHRIVADEIDDWLSGKNPMLLLSVPPQFGKSELASRRLPAYAFGRNPNERILQIGYTDAPARDFCDDVKTILQTDRYRQVFPGVRIATSKVAGARARNTQSEFRILGSKGRYDAAGIGGAITGKAKSIIIFDDPFKDDAQAQSPSYRAKVWAFFQKVARTRGTKDIRILVIHTRWHDDDLIGRCLEENKKAFGKWRSIVLRCEARANDPDRHPLDKRAPGEMLWPEFKDEAALAPLKDDPDTWNSLYQQDPKGLEGRIFKADWMENRWTKLPSFRGEWIWTVDPKGGSTDARSSRFVAQLWFRPEQGSPHHPAQIRTEPYTLGGEPGFQRPSTSSEHIYLIDQRKGIWEIDECLDCLLELNRDPLWSRATTRIMEKKADGAGLAKLLTNHGVKFLKMVNPHVAKDLRWKPTRPFWREGFVLLPSDDIAGDWLTNKEDGFIEEHRSAPYGANDDQIDCSTMAIEHYFMPTPAGEEEEDFWAAWAQLRDAQ